MKTKIAIAVIVWVVGIVCIGQVDGPITPEQRFALPPAGRTIDGKPFDYNSLADTNTSAETRRKVRGEPSAQERRMEERKQARNHPRSQTNEIKGNSFKESKRDGYFGAPPVEWNYLVSVTVNTNVVIHWQTIEEADGVLKQVGTLVTNRVAILTHDNGTNGVTLKELGRGEWPSQIRKVRTPTTLMTVPTRQ